MPMRKNRFLLLCATACSVSLSAPSWAQADGDTAESTNSNDIIVTARRVEERLQDVPISITVFTQQQLTNQNVSSARELATYTPSLSANSRFGNDFASFSIRGFTQEARTTASVGVYFADVVTPRSSGATAQSGDGASPGAMFDLENVQVLKGPQGTLFGRNTTGGAVILVPRRPIDKLEGYVEGSVGNHEMWRLQAVINVPLSGNVRVRAGVDIHDREGYLKNIASQGPRRLGDTEYVAARLGILADLTPDLENYTVATYSRSTPNGSAPKLTDCFKGNAPAADPLANALGCQQIAREKSKDPYSVTSAGHLVGMPKVHRRGKCRIAGDSACVLVLRYVNSGYLP